jgi:hypothetical protein
MEVSSSNIASTIQTDTLKKSLDVQEREVSKILEANQKQMQEMQQQVNQQSVAQKTGLGMNLNLMA